MGKKYVQTENGTIVEVVKNYTLVIFGYVVNDKGERIKEPAPYRTDKRLEEVGAVLLKK